MYQYNEEYSDPEFEYEQPYNEEFELELQPEFEFESDNQYEQEPEFEQEPNFEYDPEFWNGQELETDYETEPEMEYAEEFEGDFEADNEWESPQDELEAELEYVTNEGEFGKWLNKVVSKTQRRLSPVLRSPLGRRAVKQLSRIAFRTLPFIGRKKWGPSRWQRRRPGWPYNRYRTYRGYPWSGYGPSWASTQVSSFQQQQGAEGFQQPGFQQPQQSGFQPQQSSGFQQEPQQAGSPQADMQQGYQDGSFKNFVLDTLKNLSEQIARGNESLMALKNSIVNSASSNFPGILQPKTEGQEPPAQGPPKPNGTEKSQPQSEFEMGDYEYDQEVDGEITDTEDSFNEVTEMELASELLAINNEMELDYFLSGLFKKAVGWGSKLLKSPTGQLLKKVLKKVLKKGLPALGTIGGTLVGGPVGAQIGGAVGDKASDLFELELEGLSNEDKEFEVAKVFVRFAGNVAKEANDNMTGNPQDDARQAMIAAAKRYAPGLLLKGNGGSHHQRMQGGSWYRQGNKIIIEGAF